MFPNPYPDIKLNVTDEKIEGPLEMTSWEGLREALIWITNVMDNNSCRAKEYSNNLQNVSGINCPIDNSIKYC